MMPDLIDIIPDWRCCLTPEQAESELGFKFVGPGWYVCPEATILAFEEGAGNNNLYWFLIFNGRNPIAAFRHVANLKRL